MKSGVRPMESGECPAGVRNCLLGRGIVRLFMRYVSIGHSDKKKGRNRSSLPSNIIQIFVIPEGCTDTLNLWTVLSAPSI